MFARVTHGLHSPAKISVNLWKLLVAAASLVFFEKMQALQDCPTYIVMSCQGVQYPCDVYARMLQEVTLSVNYQA